MDAEFHWSVWLISGLLLGMASGLGTSGAIGMVVGLCVLVSPVAIYMKAGATILPFALFYGGLIITSSFFYKRRNAKEDRQRRQDNEEMRRRRGV
ncbi:MAG: hypothetical protein OEL88_09475 [Sterolibacteriaceae bacterium MAG5]|nr:hypothetical protein [Candidatus Nitricoxidireducens bremensis]